MRKKSEGGANATTFTPVYAFDSNVLETVTVLRFLASFITRLGINRCSNTDGIISYTNKQCII